MIHLLKFFSAVCFIYTLFSSPQLYGENEYHKTGEISISLGLPVLNQLGIIVYEHTGNDTAFCNSKFNPIYQIEYSNKISKKLNYKVNLSFVSTEIIGPSYNYSYQEGFRWVDYNVYTKIATSELRIGLFIEYRIHHTGKTDISFAMGTGTHLYPSNPNKWEATVSHFYDNVQDTSIHNFPELAKNKKTPIDVSRIGANYFFELCVTRKISDRFSLVLKPCFSHFSFAGNQHTDHDTSIFKDIGHNNNTEDNGKFMPYDLVNQNIISVGLGLRYRFKKN